MSTITTHRLPLLIIAGMTALTLACFVLVGGEWVPVRALPWYWLSLGGLAAFAIWAVRGNLLIAVMLWFASLIAFHEEFWRYEAPGFFALTLPRIGIVVLVLLFAAMLAQRRVRLRPAWPIGAVMAAVAAAFCVSAVVSGFETRSVVSVHYRLIGGYLFPFAVFVLVLHGIDRERDFRRLAVFFAVVAGYLTFTGWCEQWNLHALVFPRFIVDPGVGIHWGRVRGPFVMSAAMGLALTYCYFNNLMLARNLARGRWLLYALNALMLPVIFWTKTRSVWLAFAVCSLLWVSYSRRKTTRVAGVCVLLALSLLIAVLNMDNFLGKDRAKGGLTDMEPILLRIGLAKMTWQMLEEHPLFGVGFGHFRDHAPAYARDPSSGAYAFGSSALEHNNLLSIAAETGAVGVTLTVALVVLLMRCSIRLYRRLPACGAGFINRDLVVLYWILIAAYLIDGTFRETSDNPFANSLFFGLSGVPVALDILLSPVPIRARPGFPPLGRSSPARSARTAPGSSNTGAGSPAAWPPSNDHRPGAALE